MHSARTSQDAQNYYDDGLTPRGLNIQRSQLGQNAPSSTRPPAPRSESTKESQDSTPRRPLRVRNPDVAHEYRDHRRAAIYVPSPAQQALQRVVTPQRSTSTQSSRSRLSSLGSGILNTVKRRKPKRETSKVSERHSSTHNPLRVPPGSMSDTESASAGGFSRSVSLNSHKSNIAEPRSAAMSMGASFAHTENAPVSPLEYLTPGGVACAELELQSFTAVYAPDDFHYSPAVSVWAVATITCVRYHDGAIKYSSDGANSSVYRSQLTVRSHGQIANLVLNIAAPEGFDVISILGRLQHRQVLLGGTWSAVFKLQPQQKICLPPKGYTRLNDSQNMNTFPRDTWAVNSATCLPVKTENDKLMHEVERMLIPEAELVAQVQYSHSLFPDSTTVQEYISCPIKAITEVERRHRQFHEQRGQTWRRQRDTSAVSIDFGLDRDLQMANAICAVLQESVGAKWPKTSMTSVKYTTIPPQDALQLLYDFREAAGATLPQDVKAELDRLKGVYQQVLKERQEVSFTRKSLRAVYEMGRLARRAIPTSSTFSGQYSHHAPSVSSSVEPLNSGSGTPENRMSNYSNSVAATKQPWDVSKRNALELDRADFDLQAALTDITNNHPRRHGVARFIDTLPILGRRKNARTDISERDHDLEKGVREEDQEIKAIWKRVRAISGASSTISDDMERINESNLGGPPWM